jgi:hypothetical protein
MMSNRRRKALLGSPRKSVQGLTYQDLVTANQRWLLYAQQLLAPGVAAEERILQVGKASRGGIVLWLQALGAGCREEQLPTLLYARHAKRSAMTCD